MANLTSEMMTVVSANTRPYVSAMKRGERSTRSFGKVVTSVGVGALKSFSQAGIAAVGVFGAYLTVQKAAETAMRSIDLAAEAEQQRVAFEVLLGSAQDAKRLMNEIQQFAAATPFQQAELQDAAKGLTAFGVESKKIVPTLKTLGNLSSGLGINIGELAEIYGKAKVQGRLFMEDINQLTGRGIPVIAELAKQFGVAESEVRNLVSSGEVNFSHLEKSFVALTSEGGKFNGMIQKQSETFKGLSSTLKDNLDLALRNIGETLMKELNMKQLLKDTIAFVKRFGPAFTVGFQEAIRAGKDLAGTVYNVANLLKGLEKLAQGSFLKTMVTISEVVTDIYQQIVKMMRGVQVVASGSGNVGLSTTMRQNLDLMNVMLADHEDRLKRWRSKSNELLMTGGDQYAKAMAGGFKQDLLNYLKSGSIGSEGIKINAPVAGRAPSPQVPTVDFSKLIGFGHGLAGVGGAIGSRVMTDIMALSGSQMGPNSAVLKGSTQAASLEAERNRAQLDVGKSQLEELREMKQSLNRLVELGIGQKDKAVEAFGGLF